MEIDLAKNSLNDVCVIIAAKNAATTIAKSVRSALAQPEAAEVVVVDDGSDDATEAVARSMDDGTGRLTVARFKENRGPSAARNYALSITSSPILGVLDADDFLLPGRLQRLLSEDSWDLIADNVAFIDAEQSSTIEHEIRYFDPDPQLLDFISFIEGNISRRHARRAEIGFLKPLMRREFLQRHRLQYNETLRLGEDYDLYARALAAGARYKILRSCGYAAVVRGNSLSGSHRTIDLKRLYEADQAILAENTLPAAAAATLARHARHIRDRYELRRFLDIKNHEGLANALRYLLTHPSSIRPAISGVIRDKIEVFASKPSSAPTSLGGTGGIRYLLGE
ncbi:glycosyltransferase family 2 protein [Pararhizobium sp. LjRoot255]|uniref:glycosyltransferase family 2 protein n=1 Tax=Pararhizobium sp. LjRoot255 TaxID=3342298 RepID=UPI003ED0DC4C